MFTAQLHKVEPSVGCLTACPKTPIYWNAFLGHGLRLLKTREWATSDNASSAAEIANRVGRLEISQSCLARLDRLPRKHYLETRDCSTSERSQRLCPVAQTLGGGTNFQLAGPLATPEPRLRTSRRLKRSHGANRINWPHAPATRPTRQSSPVQIPTYSVTRFADRLLAAAVGTAKTTTETPSRAR